MSLYKRGEVYWAEVWIDGERTRQSTDTADRAEAQRIHDELKAASHKRPRFGFTLNDVLLEWLQETPRTKNERNCAIAFVKLHGDTPLAEVTPTSVRNALAGKSPGTYNRYVSLVSAALNLAFKRGMLRDRVVLDKKRQPPGRTRWLTYEEWQRLQQHLSPHLLTMARFAVATGLRYSNVRDLLWADVDLEAGIAWVHADQSKSGKVIRIPLNAEAVDVLLPLRDSGTANVFTYKGEPITGSVKTAWNRSVRDAGLKGLVWHDLRHTWASWHVRNGTPLEVLQRLGGWASLDMVMRYAHLAPDYVAQYAGNAAPQIPPTQASQQL